RLRAAERRVFRRAVGVWVVAADCQIFQNAVIIEIGGRKRSETVRRWWCDDCRCGEGAVALAPPDQCLVAFGIRDVGETIAVEIPNHSARRAPGHFEDLERGEHPGALVDEDFNLLSLKRRQVHSAIVIEIACSKREYRQLRRRRSSRSEGSVAIVEEEGFGASAAASDQEIRPAIAIDIYRKRRPGAWDGIYREVAKTAVMVVEEDIEPRRLFGNNRHVGESIAIEIGKHYMIGEAARRK